MKTIVIVEGLRPDKKPNGQAMLSGRLKSLTELERTEDSTDGKFSIQAKTNNAQAGPGC
jgi:hypothetical protein